MTASVRSMRPQVWTLMSSKPRGLARLVGLSGASGSTLLATRFGHTLLEETVQGSRKGGAAMLMTYSRSLNSSSPWEEELELKGGRQGDLVKLARRKGKMLT